MSDFIDKVNSLTPLARKIICEQATEHPHSGRYNHLQTHGTYLCRRCGLALFRASNQFSASCGWPSFDDEIIHTIKRIKDCDGLRTEIRCHRCDGHLGHIFIGEYLTHKNQRYCVNSASIDFVKDDKVLDSEEIILAGGCFWGVDYYMKRVSGVVSVESGYSGGHILNPSYHDVCHGNSHHFEVVRVIFDTTRTNLTSILKRFFEIHDPTQLSGQGPDIGHQYQSAVFYYNQEQLIQTNVLIAQLKQNGYDATTQLLPVHIFWPAEEYHQDYYEKTGRLPYCHQPIERFKK